MLSLPKNAQVIVFIALYTVEPVSGPCRASSVKAATVLWYVMTCTILFALGLTFEEENWLGRKTGQHRSDPGSIARERRVAAACGKHDSTKKRMAMFEHYFNKRHFDMNDDEKE